MLQNLLARDPPMTNHLPTTFLGVAAKLLAASSAIYFFSFVTADPDLWGHIRFGEDLWKAKTLSRVDPYSFTAHGQPWINHEWLAELIFYLTYRHLGDAGLLFGKLGIGLIIVSVVWKIGTFRNQAPLVSAGVIVLAIYVISPGFMTRPQVFSFLFFTLFLYVLHAYSAKQKNLLFLLPCIMALWVNLHAGFLMGWALMAVVVASKTLASLVSGKNQDEVRSLWLWFVAASLATLLNPYGYNLIVFLYKSLSVPRPISEWKAVTLWDLSSWHTKVLIVLFLATLLAKLKQSQGWEVAAIVMTLIASLLHQRHTPFFGIMVAPYLVLHFSGLTPKIKARFPTLTLSRLSKTFIAVFLVLVSAYQIYHGTGRYVLAYGRIIVDPRTYPVAAVRFLQHNNIKGNLLLPFDWGEYAIWKLYPGCKVSIDGRFRTVYPQSVIQDHFIAENDRARWRALIEKYPSDILLASQIPFFQELIKQGGPWIYVYSDLISIVFLRNNQKNRLTLQRFETGRFEYPETAPSVYFP